MKLTLTREQIQDARDTLAWLRSNRIGGYMDHRSTPGFAEWFNDDRDDCSENEAWASALEAAITEAEGGKDVDPRQPGPVSDADERAFWREAYAWARQFNHAPGRSAHLVASDAADEADAALARYRKAFCAGMPSDQKGSDR
jgi:hypothetical protein